MGPVELPLGQAAVALGGLDPAVDVLRAAASICDFNGARGCARVAEHGFTEYDADELYIG
jgi:hypothetical protein